MAHNKYITSGGLGFSEDRDMEKLRKNALKGWHLKRFRFNGYELEKGNPEDVIFNVDFRLLDSDEEGEYFDMFSQAGWEHVCSDAGFHIFKAKNGTEPIYSDKESIRDKVDRMAYPVKSIFTYCIGLIVILVLIMAFTSGVFEELSKWGVLLSIVPTTLVIVLGVAIFYRKWKGK